VNVDVIQPLYDTLRYNVYLLRRERK
jgi:hypothetical protein